MTAKVPYLLLLRCSLTHLRSRWNFSREMMLIISSKTVLWVKYHKVNHCNHSIMYITSQSNHNFSVCSGFHWSTHREYSWKSDRGHAREQRAWTSWWSPTAPFHQRNCQGPRPMKIGKFVDNHVLRELLVKKTGANKSNKPSSREWWPTCL